jgi:glutathione peroxidase
MSLLSLILSILPGAPAADAGPLPNSLYEMKAKSIDGVDVDLAQYKGKVALVVNTASKCGYTPQYKPLQELYDKYSKEGFVVLGFPSNDFMWQEPGNNQEIKKFCLLHYGVTFPLFEKDHVKGRKKQPVYNFLTSSPVGKKDGDPGWNFTKFIVDKNGQVAARFATKIDPMDPQVTAKIEELLKQ